MTRSMGWVAGSLVVGLALLVAGCSFLPAPDGFQVTLPSSQEIAGDLPVVVVDDAGIVLEVGVGEGAPGEVVDEQHAVGIDAVPGRDDAVDVSWIGGACDQRSIVTIAPDGDRYRVGVENQTTASGCAAVAVPRSVRLTLNEAIGPEAFVPWWVSR